MDNIELKVERAGMQNVELAFVALPEGLSVRSFVVREAVNTTFEVDVVARTSTSDLDLEALVGKGAVLRLRIGEAQAGPRARAWSGIARAIEQLAVEDDGLSTYRVHIVPMLWRTTQRRGHRIFQHLTTPQIVVRLLEEWGITPELRLDEATFPRHEYRVQYDESDFDFLSRLLEEAGVSYWLEQADPLAEGELEHMRVVLCDTPRRGAHAHPVAIPFAGDTGDVPPTAHVRNVRLLHELRPGRVTLRDHDFRVNPELRLSAEVRVPDALEARYEHYHFVPGSFLAETGGTEAGATVDHHRGEAAARVALESARTHKRVIELASNVFELAAGMLFTLAGHPRAELCEPGGLLLSAVWLSGERDQKWTLVGRATPSVDPFRPAMLTRKPRIQGVQSALVVGPPGEEIYTDGHGRVRVQFPWDREGRSDEHSSCWVRVSHAWAGGSYGFFALPRVGHEVLVDFVEGDPDAPIIVGRVHHVAAQAPHALPQHKTRTTWRSQSSPGGGGSNEITFEDAAGEEKVYVHAERDHEEIVEHDARASIHNDLFTAVKRHEQRSVGGDQSLGVSGDRVVTVGGQLTTHAAAGLQLQAGATTGVFCEEGRLVLTNGAASIVLDGPNILIQSAASLELTAGQTLAVGGKRVTIDGGPEVFINCATSLRPLPALLPSAMEAVKGLLSHGGGGVVDLSGVAGLLEKPGALVEAGFEKLDAELELLGDKLKLPELAPVKVELPPLVNQQLQQVSEMSQVKGPLVSKVLESEAFKDMKKRLDDKLAEEKARLEKLGKDLHGIFDRQRDHVVELGKTLKARAVEEKKALKDNWAETKAIFRGERGNLLQSAKALVAVVKDETNRIKKLRTDLKAMLDTEKAYFKGAVDEWKGAVEDVKSTIDHFKNLIDNPKDEVLGILFGENKEAVEKFLDDPKKAINDFLDDKGLGDIIHVSNVAPPALPGGGQVAPPPIAPPPNLPPPGSGAPGGLAASPQQAGPHMAPGGQGAGHVPRGPMQGAHQAPHGPAVGQGSGQLAARGPGQGQVSGLERAGAQGGLRTEGAPGSGIERGPGAAHELGGRELAGAGHAPAGTSGSLASSGAELGAQGVPHAAGTLGGAGAPAGSIGALAAEGG
ncbi:MAG: type VI secretion system tip protein VgrG, partial [Myxococcales bacterium]|nr:type VI secretion system tip protein VgrG [Myxococcales bacterium]